MIKHKICELNQILNRLLIVVEERRIEKLLPLLEDLIDQRALVGSRGEIERRELRRRSILGSGSSSIRRGN